jgi:CRP-like cAMP-binding protein
VSDTTDALRRFAAESPLVAADVGAILALAEIDQLRHELRLARQAREAVRAERDELRRLLETARAEADRLREALCDVIGLASRAVAATAEPAGVSVVEDDGSPD